MISSFGISKKGKDHIDNQDRFFISDELHLYAVADGVTIPSGGGAAAELAVKLLKKYFSGNLEQTFQKINEYISNERRKYVVGFTTLTAVYIVEDNLTVTNVGDSPCFVVNNDIELVNKLDRSFDGYLLQAIGQKTIHPHSTTKKIGKNNYIILTSDGISDVLPQEKILQTVKREKEVEQIAKKIVSLAETSFQVYNDDKTIVVIKYG